MLNRGNEGHGIVFPRPDGQRARCGGPAICAACALDLARKERVEANRTGPAAVAATGGAVVSVANVATALMKIASALAERRAVDSTDIAVLPIRTAVDITSVAFFVDVPLTRGTYADVRRAARTARDRSKAVGRFWAR